MSSGHDHPDWAGLSSQAIDRLLKNPEVTKNLYRVQDICRDYDLPYLGGYSENGEIVYIDRHLPDELTIEVDGHKKTFDPARFITMHERFEKAVMDACGWAYGHSHQAANGYERRGVLSAGLPWNPYNEALKPFIKADEHEALKKVPANLDMKPYYAPPVDKALIARMEKAMGIGEDKQNKKDVDYSDGHPGSHCGWTPTWPRCACKHFLEPHSCEKVKGYIEPKKWCSLYAQD
jgi:hypothetical protein